MYQQQFICAFRRLGMKGTRQGFSAQILRHVQGFLAEMSHIGAAHPAHHKCVPCTLKVGMKGFYTGMSLVR